MREPGCRRLPVQVPGSSDGENRRQTVYALGPERYSCTEFYQIIFRNRVGHRYYSSFAHRIGEAVLQARRSGNGRDIQDYTTAVELHVADRRVHTVVIASDVHAEDQIEILRAGSFQCSDICHSKAVHQDMDAIVSPAWAFVAGKRPDVQCFDWPKDSPRPSIRGIKSDARICGRGSGS